MASKIPHVLDRVGRFLLVLSAISAFGAFVFGLGALRAAEPQLAWLETWRTLGFFVFAGLFALLAWRPRLQAGVWELVILNKAALSVLGFAYGTPESLAAAPIDGGLAVVLVAAYLCTRGWRSWRRAPEA